MKAALSWLSMISPRKRIESLAPSADLQKGKGTNRKMRLIAQLRLAAVSLLLLTGCSRAVDESLQDNPDAIAGRWYTQAQVIQGETIFSAQCASCHGGQAEGLTDDWRQRLEDGSFPPPPLNGSAHAWHHPLSVLMQVVNEGGEPLGGKMPAFADILTEHEKRAAIAYFQDFWDDSTYDNWLQMGGTN